MKKYFAVLALGALLCAASADAAEKKKAYELCADDFSAQLSVIMTSLSSGPGWEKLSPEGKAALFRARARAALGGKNCTDDRAAKSYPAQAVLLFSKELEINPSASAYGQLARAEFYLGGEENITKSLADLDRAINQRADDDDTPWYRGRALIRLSGNQYREAVADSTKALQRHPGDAESRRIRADAYVKLEDYAKAADDMTYFFAHNNNCPSCVASASESSACKILAEKNHDVTGCKNMNYFVNKKRRHLPVSGR